MSKHKKQKNYNQNINITEDSIDITDIEELDDIDEVKENGNTIEENITEVVEIIDQEESNEIQPDINIGHPDTIISNKYYHVGTGWKNGNCLNHFDSFVIRDQAIKAANTATKNTGVVHNVYDPTGKIIFTAKTKLTLFAKKKRGVNYVNRNVK